MAYLVIRFHLRRSARVERDLGQSRNVRLPLSSQRPHQTIRIHRSTQANSRGAMSPMEPNGNAGLAAAAAAAAGPVDRPSPAQLKETHRLRRTQLRRLSRAARQPARRWIVQDPAPHPGNRVLNLTGARGRGQHRPSSRSRSHSADAPPRRRMDRKRHAQPRGRVRQRSGLAGCDHARSARSALLCDNGAKLRRLRHYRHKLFEGNARVAVYIRFADHLTHVLQTTKSVLHGTTALKGRYRFRRIPCEQRCEEQLAHGTRCTLYGMLNVV